MDKSNDKRRAKDEVHSDAERRKRDDVRNAPALSYPSKTFSIVVS